MSGDVEVFHIDTVNAALTPFTGDLTPLPTSPYTYPQPGRTVVQDIAVTP